MKNDPYSYGKFLDESWELIKQYEDDAVFARRHNEFLKEHNELTKRASYNPYEEMMLRIFKKVCL